jgi:dCTP deaminase
MLLPDWKIKELAITHKMIEPFEEKLITKGVISYGLSSYGYDIRLADEFKIFTNVFNALVDPKDFDEKSFIDYRGDYVIIPPNSFVLGRSVEYIRMPSDVLGICIGKSTYARCGIIVNITPLEPGWQGYLVIEISNSTPLPVKVYANEGIAQIIFIQGEPCEVTYASRKGKYQNQTEILTARV